MFTKLGRKATPLPAPPDTQLPLTLLDIRRGQEDLIRRLIRMETRLVLLMKEHRIDTNGRPVD